MEPVCNNATESALGSRTDCNRLLLLSKLLVAAMFSAQSAVLHQHVL